MINYDLKKIKALAFDVDGVLSTSNVLLIEGGQPCRTANTKDGYALQYAIKCGIEIAIITGGNSPLVRQRYEALGIKDIFMGTAVKLKCFNEWLRNKNISADQVLYMGDDIPDYEVMKKCGCACCPNDAAIEIKNISCYISPHNGGQGCVRDVIEQVMRAHQLWMTDSRAFGW